MALATSHTPPPGGMAPPQKPTQGVGTQGDAPSTAPLPPLEPVLFQDIDPVLLVRLYPAAKDSAEMRAQAMAAGTAAAKAGAELVASQQEPVPEAGTPPPGTPPPTRQPPPHEPPPPEPHQAPKK